jgi:hypothetical protein
VHPSPIEKAIHRLNTKVEGANLIFQNVSNEAARAKEQVRTLKRKLKLIRKTLKTSKRQAKMAARRKKVARKALQDLVDALLEKQKEHKISKGSQ